MQRSATVLASLLSTAALLATAAPALAGGDWDDDYYYESRHWRDYRVYSGAPAYRVPRDEVYIPYYGAYFADEPIGYGPNCEVERSWRHGRYREKIECDDDD
jgi:hypothetical protein